MKVVFIVKQIIRILNIAPNEDIEVNNCQVLGRAFGNNSDEAQDSLLKENPWIIEAGFDKSEFIVRQLA